MENQTEEPEGKDLFASRRFWGVVVAVLGPILNQYFGIAGADLEGLTNTIVVLAGALISLWGYVSRRKRITSVAGVPMTQTTKLVILVLPLLVLYGCATPAKTTEERLYYAYASLVAVRDSAATLLSAGRISVDEAKKVQAKADDVRCGLDLARSQLGGPAPACDRARLTAYFKDLAQPPTTAAGWLDLSSRVLFDLERQLREKGG